MGFALFQFILDYPVFSRIQGIEFVLFAFGAFTYAKHPEGIVEFQKTRWMNRVARVLQRWDERRGREPSAIGSGRRHRPDRGRTPKRSWSGFRVADESTLLEARSISKRFGGITALHDISISIDSWRDRRTRRPERRRQDDVVQLPERPASPGAGEHLVLRSTSRPDARLPQGPARASRGRSSGWRSSRH